MMWLFTYFAGIVIMFAFLSGCIALLIVKTVACIFTGRTTARMTRFLLIVIWVVLLGVIMVLVRGYRNAQNRFPPAKSIIEENEGRFPLNKKGFSKTVLISQQPLSLYFGIVIQTPQPSCLNLNDAVLKLEAIEGEQVIGTQLVHGDKFWGLTQPESVLTNRFSVFAIQHKGGSGSTETYFRLRKPATYRLTVIQPCEDCEHVETELWTTRFY